MFKIIKNILMLIFIVAMVIYFTPKIMKAVNEKADVKVKEFVESKMGENTLVDSVTISADGLNIKSLKIDNIALTNMKIKGDYKSLLDNKRAKLSSFKFETLEFEELLLKNGDVDVKYDTNNLANIIFKANIINKKEKIPFTLTSKVSKKGKVFIGSDGIIKLPKSKINFSHAEYAPDGNMKFKGHGDIEILEALSFINMKISAKGTLKFKCDIKAVKNNVSGHLNISSRYIKIHDINLSDIKGKIDVTNNKYNISNTKFNLFGGQGFVTGNIKDENLKSCNLKLKLKNVDLNKLPWTPKGFSIDMKISTAFTFANKADSWQKLFNKFKI